MKTYGNCTTDKSEQKLIIHLLTETHMHMCKNNQKQGSQNFRVTKMDVHKICGREGKKKKRQKLSNYSIISKNYLKIYIIKINKAIKRQIIWPLKPVCY